MLLNAILPVSEVISRLPTGKTVPAKVVSPVVWIDPESVACAPKAADAAELIVKLWKGAVPTLPVKVIAPPELNVTGLAADGAEAF